MRGVWCRETTRQSAYGAVSASFTVPLTRIPLPWSVCRLSEPKKSRTRQGASAANGAIRRFKYAGASWLARPLGKLLAGTARGYAGSVHAVVPLALHPRKLRARGYNPAALLARAVARELDVPLRTSWLRRERGTRSQAGLTRDARLANVRGAFRAPAIRACRLLLVDDVRTTGATLAEAAATLAARGHTVQTLALAWSEG